MKRHPLLWITAIVVLVLSAFGLGVVAALELPALIGWALALAGGVSIVAIMLLEEWAPLQK